MLLTIGSSIIIEKSIVTVVRWHIIGSFFMTAYIFSLKSETRLLFEREGGEGKIRVSRNIKCLKRHCGRQQRSQLTIFRSVAGPC